MKLANSESAWKLDQDYIIRFVKKVDFEKVYFVRPMTGCARTGGGLEKPTFSNLMLLRWNLQIRNQREQLIKIE